jgi:hypothetical protein
MGKLLVSIKESISKLREACTGLVALEAIVGNDFQRNFLSKEPLQRARDIQITITTPPMLDCSPLLSRSPEEILLLELIKFLYKEQYASLLQKELQRERKALIQARNDFIKIYPYNGTVFDRLSSIKSHQVLLAVIVTEIETNYQRLLAQAYLGLQNLLQLAEMQVSCEESALVTPAQEELLRFYRQKIEENARDPIDFIGIDLSIPACFGKIINTFYKFSLQQKIDKLKASPPAIVLSFTPTPLMKRSSGASASVGEMSVLDESSAVDKTPYVEEAVRVRGMFLDLKIALQEFSGNKEATLATHRSTLMGWSVAQIQETARQDSDRVIALKERASAIGLKLSFKWLF